MLQDQNVTAGGLDGLFAAYREACPDREPGPDFMPQLWEKIEARRAFAYNLKRLARGIITTAAAASLLMGAYLVVPRHTAQPTYLEVLAAAQSPDDSADSEIVQSVYENSR
jgi:hypothetical protein